MTTTRRIFHHLRFDLRRHWKLFPLLAAALVAFGVIDIIRFYGEPRQFAADLFMLAAFGFAVIMALMVVQGDPGTGSEAFWMTRPLRGREIFISKAITLLLIAILMLAGWIVPPILTGAFPAVPGLIRDYWIFFLPILTGFLAIGAFTRNLPQALLAGIITWATVTAFFWIWNFTAGLPPMWEKTVAMQQTGLMLGAGLIAVGATVAALFQYLHFNLKISAALLAATIFAAILVNQYSTVDLLTNYLDPATEEALGLEDVTVNLDGTPEKLQWGNHTVHTPAEVFHYFTLSAEATYENLPPDVYLGSVGIRGTMVEKGGNKSVIESQTGRFEIRHRPFQAQFLPEGFRYLQSSWMKDPAHVPSAKFLNLDRAVYPSLRGRDWRYQGVATGRLATLKKIATIPLGVEKKLHQPEWTALVSSNIDDRSLSVRLRTVSWRPGTPAGYHGILCLIANPQRMEALPPRTGGGASGGGSIRHSYADRHFLFELDIRDGKDRIQIAEDWLAEAEVVVYVEQPVGVIRRPVTIESLELPEIEAND